MLSVEAATNPNRHVRSGRPVELIQGRLVMGWISCGSMVLKMSSVGAATNPSDRVSCYRQVDCIYVNSLCSGWMGGCWGCGGGREEGL